MRCVLGFVLFVVLYFGSCTTLGEIVRKTSGRAAEAEVLRKYHALVAVGAGVFTLFCCRKEGKEGKGGGKGDKSRRGKGISPITDAPRGNERRPTDVGRQNADCHSG
jgi:hypothetical protein